MIPAGKQNKQNNPNGTVRKDAPCQTLYPERHIVQDDNLLDISVTARASPISKQAA